MVEQLFSREDALRQREEALKRLEEEVNQKARYLPPPSPTASPNNGLPPQSQPSSSHASSPALVSALVPLGSESRSFLDDIDPHNVPPGLGKEGGDWFASFNPEVKRVLDVSLMYTLMHERYVPDEGFFLANTFCHLV